MATVRVYSNTKRLATGKLWKNGFLQVYPEVRPFTSEDDWVASWKKAVEAGFRVEREGAIPPLPASPPQSASPPLPPQPAPSEKGWSYRRELTFRAPAGTYYIGDLCYALYDNIYDKVFGGHGYDCGFYSRRPDSFFMVDGTTHGDGDYTGSDGHHYLVDAGIIGICSADLIDTNNTSIGGGKIHTFTEPVEIRFRGGCFYFHSGYEALEINTQGWDDDADDEEDY